MSVAGYATLEVIPSMKGLRSSLEKQSAGDLAAAGRTGGAKFGDEAGKAGATSFKSRFSTALKGFAPFAGLAAGAGVTALFKSAIDEASGLSEAGNKVNVVFGDAAAAVQEFAANASEGIGQSERQALEATGTFGNLFRSIGLAEQQSATFATTLVGLASDLASFNNVSVDDALLALRSGLVGETEPLKRFGVNLSEATLKAKAFEMGLGDGKTTLDANAKAQAAYALILEQTTLAQGDFARTSDGLANKQRTLSARWDEMQAQLGQELLPATTALVGFLSDDAIPALAATGGVVKDVVAAFGQLPAPVQAAAAAFVALKVASSFGVGTALASGAAAGTKALDGLRLRTELYAIGVQDARVKTVQFAGTSAQVSTGVGRMSAAMQGLKAATTGVGAGMKAGLGSLVGFLGGPWGVAIIAATAGVTLWYQAHQRAQREQEESEARVRALTATLNENTGAITKNTKATVNQALEEAGLLELAEQAGMSLEMVSKAALGNQDAIEGVETAYLSALEAFRQQPTEELQDVKNAASQLFFGLQDVTGETREAIEAGERLAAANLRSAGATDRITQALSVYRAEIDDTKTMLAELIKVEEERAANAIQSRRDQLGLISTLEEVQDEARKGKATLDTQTEAGRANMSALLDLADQWTNSTEKVQNARGAYEEMRRNFIEVAREMGATEQRARKLADELLKVPPNAKVKFQSEGYESLMAQLRALREQKRLLNEGGVVLQLGRNNIDPNRAFASGGLIGGIGSGTSDDNLIWASRGEFMQRKAAVDYYGVEFMRKLNALQLPKFPGYAQGGLIQPAPQPVAAVAGLNVGHMTVVAQDWRDFVRKGQQKAQSAMSDGVRWG